MDVQKLNEKATDEEQHLGLLARQYELEGAAIDAMDDAHHLRNIVQWQENKIMELNKRLEGRSNFVVNNPDEAAKILAPLWGNLPQEVVLKANANRSYNVKSVTIEDMPEQQKISDAFFNEKLIPNTIDAKTSDLYNTQ